MKKIIWTGAIIIAISGLIVLSSAAFVVDETQQAIITEFGKPVGEPIDEPGLHFKTPFVQKATFFDKRFLEWNGDANQVPTKDKRFIWVDTYARWRITDPLLFYQRLRNEAGGQSRLDDIIDGETRDAVANHDLLELVRSTNREPTVDPDLKKGENSGLEEIAVGRTELMQDILTDVDERTKDLGIEVIDVRFKRIDYIDDVRKSVYQRMIAERNRIAEQYRSEGRGEAANIRGQKEKELKQINSTAFETSEKIRGEADAQATKIYANAYTQDPDFYRFLRTMESYRNTLDQDSMLLLSTENEFFEYLQSTQKR